MHQYFIYYPQERGKIFPIIVTFDVTNKNFKKVFPEVVGENPIKKPIFIRDFSEKLVQLRNHSGERRNEYTIHYSVTQNELEELLGEKIS